MGSPTQRSLAELRSRGYVAWVCEHWNAYTRRRVDLFNAWDILAVGNGETLAVQTTSASNVSARVHKIADNPYTPLLRAAGWRLEVHGWRKVRVKRGGKAVRWALRLVDVS